MNLFQLSKNLVFLKCHATGNDYIVPFHPDAEKQINLVNTLLSLKNIYNDSIEYDSNLKLDTVSNSNENSTLSQKSQSMQRNSQSSGLNFKKTSLLELFIQKLCTRRFSIGSDGMLLLNPKEVRMRMYNPDGSEAEMCGNGLRCAALFFAKYFKDVSCYDLSQSHWVGVDVQTQAGLKKCIVNTETNEIECSLASPKIVTDDIPLKRIFYKNDSTTQIQYLQDLKEIQKLENVSIKQNEFSNQQTYVLGITTLQSLFPEMNHSNQFPENQIITHDNDKNINVYCISMGNPHAVIYVKDADQFPIEIWGPLIENHPIFCNRTNVEFVSIIDSECAIVRQRTWERGAGETFSCGTGGAAVASVSYILRKIKGNEIHIQMNGGMVHYTCIQNELNLNSKSSQSEMIQSVSTIHSNTQDLGSITHHYIGIDDVKLRGEAEFTYKGEIELDWSKII